MRIERTAEVETQNTATAAKGTIPWEKPKNRLKDQARGRQRPLEMKFRVSEEEAAFIHQKMERIGVRNREAYLRKMAIDGYCVSLDLTAIREYTRELNAIGNNLNQLTKVANAGGCISEKAVHEMKENFEKLREDSAEIVESLAFLQEGRRLWKTG